VLQQVEIKRPQRIQVQFLDVERGRLQNDLKLKVFPESIGVFAVTSIGWTTRRLDVCHTPGLRSQCSQIGVGIKRTRSFLHIVRLLNDTALFRPEVLQSQYQLLEIDRHLLVLQHMLGSMNWFVYGSMFLR
jgi:hypothetical protein